MIVQPLEHAGKDPCPGSSVPVKSVLHPAINERTSGAIEQDAKALNSCEMVATVGLHHVGDPQHCLYHQLGLCEPGLLLALPF